MTTETPFTVADLRRWATSLRAEADRTAALKYPTPYGLSIIPVYLAQAAAFDALAAGMEAADVRIESTDSFELSDAFVRGNNEARREIGRILKGEKQ